MAFVLSHCYLLLLILPLANHIKIVKVGFGNLIIIGSSSDFPNNCFLTCSFFVEFAAFFVRKKEQARGESRGERSKGRGEMDVGERGEWKRIGRIGRDRKIGIPILLIQLVTICHQLIH